MNLRSFFNGAPEEDLSSIGLTNPTNNNPKKIYVDIFLEGLDTYRNMLKGGTNENNVLSIYVTDPDKMQVMKYAPTNSGNSVWILFSTQENLMPKINSYALIVLIASLTSDLRSGVRGELNEQGKELLRNWAGFLQFVESFKGRSDRTTIAQLIGHGKTLDESIAAFLAIDPRGAEEVLGDVGDTYTENPDLTSHFALSLDAEKLLERLDSAQVSAMLDQEENRMGLVTHLAASMTQNLLLLGPPGTGKTYIVQRSINHIPIVQVSLEGSTEPETVVANIAQTPDGKFKAFLAETAKALKLGMLLAIVERLRQGRTLKVEETEDQSEILGLLGKIPKSSAVAQMLLSSRSSEQKVSEDLHLILKGIASTFNNERALKAWLSVLDIYADPFELGRWEEILYVYQDLEAHAVGTTCVLNIEEIYHAVENRKILDLLINLMAGQKKLPLSKAGVVGGELYGHNVSVFATGNPIHETYLPPALESRFGFKEFMGYPDDVEEKRRMQETLNEYLNPAALSLNLISTRLEDFPNAVPLPKKQLTVISDDLRDKIYNLVNWTRGLYDNNELRNCADPRMSKNWELLTSAFMAEGLTEKDAFLLAVKSTVMGLVSIDHKGEPDPEGIKNIFQQAESYFLA